MASAASELDNTSSMLTVSRLPFTPLPPADSVPTHLAQVVVLLSRLRAALLRWSEMLTLNAELRTRRKAPMLLMSVVVNGMGVPPPAGDWANAWVVKKVIASSMVAALLL